MDVVGVHITIIYLVIYLIKLQNIFTFRTLQSPTSSLYLATLVRYLFRMRVILHKWRKVDL